MVAERTVFGASVQIGLLAVIWCEVSAAFNYWFWSYLFLNLQVAYTDSINTIRHLPISLFFPVSYGAHSICFFCMYDLCCASNYFSGRSSSFRLVQGCSLDAYLVLKASAVFPTHSSGHSDAASFVLIQLVMLLLASSVLDCVGRMAIL
jgi:hypothetical protein